MGGADRADPFNGPYGFLHKAYVYFWRRVLEQKLQQALTNVWLLFVAWRDTLNCTRVGISQDDFDRVKK